MNYQHIYHVGNICDVVKHLALTLILQKLIEKPTAFEVMETHAGAGLYNLNEQAAQKTQEYQAGIMQLIKSPNSMPELQGYLKIIKDLNPRYPILSCYPGSPYISQKFLRADDCATLVELHPKTYQLLYKQFSDDSRIHTHHQDGYLALKALLPLRKKRGLIFVDPPFEDKNEFNNLSKALTHIYQRCRHTIIAVWYPIKHHLPAQQFYRNIQSSDLKNVLLVEFLIYPANNEQRLNGCGMIFVNPPWQLEQQLTRSLPILLQYLGYTATGSINIRNLA